MYTYVGVLVANKTDLNKRRLISEAQGRQFAASKELEYFECSAVSEKHHSCHKKFSALRLKNSYSTWVL